jgi:hypothetical protein
MYREGSKQACLVEFLRLNPGWHTARALNEAVEGRARNIRKILNPAVRAGAVLQTHVNRRNWKWQHAEHELRPLFQGAMTQVVRLQSGNVLVQQGTDRVVLTLRDVGYLLELLK